MKTGDNFNAKLDLRWERAEHWVAEGDMLSLKLLFLIGSDHDLHHFARVVASVLLLLICLSLLKQNISQEEVLW